MAGVMRMYFYFKTIFFDTHIPTQGYMSKFMFILSVISHHKDLEIALRSVFLDIFFYTVCFLYITIANTVSYVSIRHSIKLSKFLSNNLHSSIHITILSTGILEAVSSPFSQKLHINKVSNE